LFLFSLICQNPNAKKLSVEKIAPYKAKNKIRILTAGSLFDGHDAAINIMRRIIQRSGADILKFLAAVVVLFYHQKLRCYMIMGLLEYIHQTMGEKWACRG